MLKVKVHQLDQSLQAKDLDLILINIDPIAQKNNIKHPHYQNKIANPHHHIIINMERILSSLFKKQSLLYFFGLLVLPTASRKVSITMILTILSVIYSIICLIPAVPKYDFTTIDQGGRISMSMDGSSYTVLSQSAVLYYKKVNSTYLFIDKVSPLCGQNTRVSDCTNARQWMSNDGRRVFYIHNGSVNTLRIHKFENQTLHFLQNILFPNSLSTNSLGRSSDGGAVHAKQDFLFISDNTRLQMHKFNYTIEQYQRIFFATYPVAPALKCTCSTDGKYIACIAPNLNLILHTFNGMSYITTTSTIISVNGASTLVWGFSIEQLSNNIYSMIIRFSNGAIYITEYFSLINGSISSVQTIDRASGNYFYLTKNAHYIVAMTTNSQIKLFEFDENIGKYVLYHTFIISTNIINLYVSQDAQTILYNTAGLDGPAFMYFKCDVANCLSCRNLGQCSICKLTFTLAPNYTCTCNSTQTLINSTCLTCNIARCSNCIFENICASCQANFILESNQCVCPSGRTISQVDGSCVQCMVENCYRCDKDNICAVRATATEGEISQASAAAIGLSVILFICLGSVIVYLFVKVKRVENLLQKVGVQTREEIKTQQEQPSFIKICEADDPSLSQIYRGQKNQSSLSGALPRQRRRKRRIDEYSQQQKISLQILYDNI